MKSKLLSMNVLTMFVIGYEGESIGPIEQEEVRATDCKVRVIATAMN